MLGKLRELDREFNIEQYPLLCFPEIYLLEGGYSRFWEDYSDFCEPKQYIKMEDKNYKLEKQDSLKMHKETFKLSNI